MDAYVLTQNAAFWISFRTIFRGKCELFTVIKIIYFPFFSSITFWFPFFTHLVNGRQHRRVLPQNERDRPGALPAHPPGGHPPPLRLGQLPVGGGKGHHGRLREVAALLQRGHHPWEGEGEAAAGGRVAGQPIEDQGVAGLGALLEIVVEFFCALLGNSLFIVCLETKGKGRAWLESWTEYVHFGMQFICASFLFYIVGWLNTFDFVHIILSFIQPIFVFVQCHQQRCLRVLLHDQFPRRVPPESLLHRLEGERGGGGEEHGQCTTVEGVQEDEEHPGGDHHDAAGEQVAALENHKKSIVYFTVLAAVTPSESSLGFCEGRFLNAMDFFLQFYLTELRRPREYE